MTTVDDSAWKTARACTSNASQKCGRCVLTEKRAARYRRPSSEPYTNRESAFLLGILEQPAYALAVTIIAAIVCRNSSQLLRGYRTKHYLFLPAGSHS